MTLKNLPYIFEAHERLGGLKKSCDSGAMIKNTTWPVRNSVYVSVLNSSNQGLNYTESERPVDLETLSFLSPIAPNQQQKILLSIMIYPPGYLDDKIITVTLQ